MSTEVSAHTVEVSRDQLRDFWMQHKPALKREAAGTDLENGCKVFRYVIEAEATKASIIVAWERQYRYANGPFIKGFIDKDVWQQYVTRPDVAAQQKLTSQTTLVELQQRIDTLEAQLKQAHNNHLDQVRRSRVLLERPDLPVERIVAYHHLSAVEDLLFRAAQQLSSFGKEEQCALVQAIEKQLGKKVIPA